MAYRGTFKPKNPQKYIGDVSKITYRSLIEYRFMTYLDTHPAILGWASEELIIPYYSQTDGKYRRYFTDFVVKKIDAEGRKSTMVIETKHSSEASEPKPPKKKSRKYLNECRTWVLNNDKWNAAKAYCAERGWTFAVLTEKDIGLKY